MLQKWNRFLSFLLAITLVTTMFGSDFATARVYAVEETEMTQPSEDGGMADLSIAEEVTTSTEETVSEVTEVTETTETTEEVVEEPATTDETQEEITEEETTEEEEVSEEEITDETEVKEPEEKETVVEEKLVKITYQASKGGTVSTSSEEVDINKEDAAFKGSTATPWNDKYTFVDWTDKDGNQVSTEATFVPSDVTEDATFTANFLAAEDIETAMPKISADNVKAGDMIVSVSADAGLFPEGTEIVISAVDDGTALELAQEVKENATQAKAVDIKFVKDEQELQPADAKYVHVSLALDQTIEGDDFSVLHQHDGEVKEISADVDTHTEVVNGEETSVATAAEFDVNQFSIFIVVNEEEPHDDARLNVKFMNGTTEISSVYVKKSDLVGGSDGIVHFNDIVYDPGVGEPVDGVMFRGWTSEANYTTETKKLTIDDVRSEVSDMLNAGVTDGDTVTYYAMLFKAYTVSYLDDRGASLGSSEIIFRADDPAEYQKYKVDMFFNPSDNEHNFEGWLVNNGVDKIKGYTEGKSYQNGTEIEIKGDVIFSVNAPEGHWLVFNENGKGATYNAPKFIKSDEVTQKPCEDSAMIRNGYTFGGWYTGTDLKTPFQFGKKLNSLTTVYAKWNPKTDAEYTVLIWKQNLDANGYDYVETIKLTGRTNTTVSTVSQHGSGNNAYARVNGVNKQYTGFHLKEFTKNVTITPEGNAVVNVYYDRNSYTFTFRKEWGWGYTTIHTVTRLYDQDISDIWSFIGSDGVQYPELNRTTSWMPSGSQTYTARITRMERMPAENITFTLYHSNNTTRYFHYYIEAPEGTAGDREYDGKNFILYTDLKNDFNEVYYNDDFWLLSGFSRLAITKSNNQKVNLTAGKSMYWDGRGTTLNGSYGGQDNHLYFYYTRDKYSINYMDGAYFDGNGNPVSEINRGQLHTQDDIQYQADVSSYANYVPSTTPAGYVFEGWYIDDTCTQLYEFDKMPEGGITVYAKWRQIQYRVFLHPMAGTDSTLDWGSDSQAMTFRISYGGNVSLPSGIRSGYEFAGWYTDESYAHGFNGDAYVLNESTVTAEYNKATDLTDPMDKWGNGATTNADVDRFWITKKLDLYAKWRSTLDGATGIGIIYDAKGGSPTPSDTNLYADTAKAAAAAAPSNTPAITEGGKTYESRFDHWVVQKWNATTNSYEDTDVTVLPGATFEVKKSDAREQDLETTEGGEAKKSYTIQLRAEYVKVEKSVPTHITWYNNYDGGIYRQDTDLEVNKSVTVYGLGKGESIPQRKGYIFKGWAREEESVGTTTTSTTLFISYNAETGYSADKVAADEKALYHALYAVWEALPEIKIIVSGNTVTHVYDGNTYTADYELSSDSENYDATKVSYSGESTTASGKNVGTDTKTIDIDKFSYDDPNYNVIFEFAKDADGKDKDKNIVEITPANVTVTIVGDNNTTAYNGEEHTVTGYTATADSDLYDVTKDFTFTPGQAVKLNENGEPIAARTDAGTTYMGLAADQFENKNSNFGTVTFNVTDGYQTIEKINVTVTITGHHDSTTYDGEEHKVSGYDVEISNPLYTEADFTFGGTAEAARTDAGTTNMGLADSQFTNTNTNFETVTFNVTDGYQTIVPVEEVVVTIIGHHDTTDYDGTEHSVSGYDVEVSDNLYKEAYFTFSGTAEAARTDAGTTEMGLKENQFTNTSANFAKVTFKVTDGYQTIDPINVTVTITGHNNTTDYDGEEHSVSGYDVEISNPLYKEADFTFSGTASATRTDAGTTKMGLEASQFTNTNDNFATVTFNVTDGYQTINKIDVTVTITGANNTTDYDGEEHSVSGYTATASSNLYNVAKDFTFSGTASATRTDAGTTKMGLEASQFTNTNTNFETVTFNVTDGYQTINPIDVTVTITGANNTSDYDGTEHSVSGYTATTESTLYDVTKDFTFSGTAEAARTNVGTTNMGLAAGQFTNTNTNFGTVTFNVTDGYQTIEPIDVTVTIVGANNTTAYDGEEHTITGYTATTESTLYDVTKDFTFSGTASAARTDAGTTNMGLAANQFANTNTNFGTVTFNVTDGYQTINKINATVTIVGANNTATYDGEEHTITGYTATASTELYDVTKDFTFSGTAEAARTNVGTTNMNLAASQFANTNDNFGTVTFDVTDGYQAITPVDEVVVTITGHSNTTNYDGAEHKVTGYDVEISNTLYTEADFTFSGTAEAARTDAGTTNMNLAADQFTNTNTNFAKVTFNVTDGYQTINKIDVTVTITGHTASFDYDGGKHEAAGYDVDISNPLYKQSNFALNSDKLAKAERTDAGTTNMGLDNNSFHNNNANFGTVTFNVTDGYVTINPIDVTVTIVGENNTTDYDGEAHTVSGYTATADTTLYDVQKDFTFSGTASASRTDAGTTNMGLASSQFENTNTNFGTVTFNVTDGYQAINKINATVTITGANNTTDYDGEEHSVSGYTATANSDLYNVAEDFTFSGTASATRTDVGTTNMGLAASQFTNKNTNFETVTFNVTDGYQTIDPIDVTVTITGHNNTTNYDGEEHSVSGYDVEISNSLYKEADFTFSGTASAARTDAGTTNMGLAAGQFANTNTNFGTVTFNVTDGYQTINKINATVTIVGANNTATYDSEEHSVSGYTATASTDLYNVKKDFTFSGTAEAARTEVGTTNMGLAADQFVNTNGNFETVTFNVTDGYQAITPVDEVVVTITGHNNTTNYDGDEHEVTGYDVEISNTLYTENDFTFSGTAEAARTDAGTTDMGLAADQFANTNNNFDKVTFNVTDGYQTITPINVTVTIIGASNTTDYNGSEHSVTGYTATADSDLYDVDNDFTFSGKATAARTFAGTTNMDLSADQFTNTNPNFGTVTFNVTDGYQTINPIDVTVTIVGASNTADYDGKEHKVTDYTATADSNLYDVSKDFTFTAPESMETEGLINKKPVASRTDVGTTNMGLAADQFENRNSNFKTVTFNVTDGYQTINPINVTVTIVGANNTASYDGEEHSVSGYEASASTELYDVTKDFTFSGTAEAARTIAGTTNMGLAASQFTNTNKNFGTVTFAVTDGYQTIEPIGVTVTIVGANNTSVYNGEEHTVSGYTATANSDLYDVSNDFTFNGSATAARTDAGTTDMGLKADQFENTNANFTNVTFNITDGYQTITPIENVVVTITGNTLKEDYDGTEHTVTGYAAKADNELYDVANDFTFSGIAEAKRTEAGTTYMGLNADQFANTNENFATVTFEITDGYVTVGQIDAVVTIVGNNSTNPYNGKTQTVKGYVATADTELFNVEKDIEFSGKAEASQEDIGTAYMNLATEQFASKNPNFKNVVFEVTDGYQTVTALAVTVKVTGHNKTVKYSAKEESVDGYDVAFENTVVEGAGASEDTPDASKLYKEDYITFTGTALAKGKLPNTYYMNLAEDQFSNTNDNFQVTFEVTDGYLTIENLEDGEKFYILSYTDDTSLTYDGKTHTGVEFGYRLEGGKEGQSIATKLMNAASDMLDRIADIFGFISIAADEPATNAIPVEIEGIKFNVSGLGVDVEAKDVGDYELPVKGTMTVTDEDGNDVTAQFKQYTYPESQAQVGILTIDPAAVTVTANSYSRNTAQSDPTLTAVVKAADENVQAEAEQYVKYNVSRAPGNSVGTYAITATPADGEALEDGTYLQGNFKVTYVPGTLTITAAPSGGGDTPSDPTPIPDAPTPTAAAPAGVLGARREDALTDGAAVLGARRGRTEDEANTTARVFAIVMAAAAAITALIAGKKKEEEEN